MAWGQMLWLRLSHTATQFFPFYWQQILTLPGTGHTVQPGPVSYPILGSVTVGQRKMKGWYMFEQISWFLLLLRCCP